MGRYSRIKLESFLTLEQAREQARHYSVLLPVPMSTAPPSNPVSLSGVDGITVLDLCNAYVADLEHRGSHISALDTRTGVRNYVANTQWAGVTANALTTSDVAQLMRGVAKQCSAYKANRIRSLLSAAYGSAQVSGDDSNVSVDLTRFAISSNPVTSAKKMNRRRMEGAASARLDRNLNATELGHFWRALTDSPQADTMQFKVIRLTVLLGGQRCEQLLRALASHTDLEERTLMLFDGKGNRPEARKHLLPLTALALREIEPLVQECERTHEPYLFSARRRGSHLSNGSISKTVARISDELQRTGKIKKSYEQRRIGLDHDLQRRDVNTKAATRAELPGRRPPSRLVMSTVPRIPVVGAAAGSVAHHDRNTETVS